MLYLISREFIKFSMVGGIAALTHYVMLLLIIHLTHIRLAVANIIAFAIAFWVSYFGHRHISFNADHLQHKQTLPRFIGIASIGFIFNETFLLLTHHYFQSFDLAILILITIIITAIFTFFLSKYFAFKFSG